LFARKDWSQKSTGRAAESGALSWIVLEQQNFAG
jgi:hypothetical protein